MTLLSPTTLAYLCTVFSTIPLRVIPLTTDLDLLEYQSNNDTVSAIVFSHPAQTTASSVAYDCELFKLKCHNDTDCFHRIFYAHSTCVTGTSRCKSQCKTAVLRLYENQYGRKLLQSDLSCVEAIRSDIVACNLNPSSDRIHCTLARRMCDGERSCRTAATMYEARCESQLMITSDNHGSAADRCRPECAELLADVFRSTQNGAKLADCVCWEDDALCHHMKSHVIEPCKSDALLYMNTNNGGRKITSGIQDLDDDVDDNDLNDKESAEHRHHAVVEPSHSAASVATTLNHVILTLISFVSYFLNLKSN